MFYSYIPSVQICIKMLSKLIPIILSVPHIAHYILWQNHSISQNSEDLVSKEISEKAYSISDENTEKLTEDKIITPYGARLMQALINLLFKQNYCIGKLSAEESATLDIFGIDQKIIWCGGLQFEHTKNENERKFDENRCDVLKLILQLIGSQIYQKINTSFNYFAAYVTNGKAQNVKNMFFSLLNTVISYNWQGLIPYISVKSSGYDNLADLSLQLLCVITEIKPISPEYSEELVKSEIAAKGIIHIFESFYKEDVSPKVFSINEFSRLLGRLEGQPNYSALFKGVTRLLSNFVITKNSALPNSVKELKCFNEAIIFLLRLTTLNPVFFSLLMQKLAFCIIFVIKRRYKTAYIAFIIYF